MQADQTRNASPRAFEHEEQNIMDTTIGGPRADSLYFQQNFIPSDRLSHGVGSANFVPEPFYDRGNDTSGSLGPPSSSFDSVPASQPAAAGNFLPVSASFSQAHVPSQNTFPMPASRGIHDPSGQLCPPGGRPRVSTTIWEDEGTLCFQVEAEQVTVARREDNNMINGTKLLNVAQMSRGKRDGILKNEAIRHVIKVGSMHLKGVWIPFDRALELANKNHVTDMLYPLFVQDIKKFLYHPANYARTAAVLAAATHRQALHGQSSALIDGQVESRPSMERASSMPTPLDRSLSMLTPPSSASTNSDYWSANAHTIGPISDVHSRAHSLPGTPATTPPAPSYINGAMQQPYMGSFTEPRAHFTGSRYGQQADMQRSYHHSRNTSLMSYQDEDMSSSAQSNQGDYNSLVHHAPQMQPHQPIEHNRFPSQNSFQNSTERPYGVAQQAAFYNPPIPRIPTDHRANPATPHHARMHSRSNSKGSNKIFNTPNLTTQLTRRSDKTPNGSPARAHARHSSSDGNTQASLWVQQQQQLAYNTPQQTRSHARQHSNQLPQIYEETPSCRMAYQLHGQDRQMGTYAHTTESVRNFPQSKASPMQLQQQNRIGEAIASPLSGKKKRERIVSDTMDYYHEQAVQDDRQESLTPPPLQKASYEESPKRRRSVRTGNHSRSGSTFEC